MLFGKVEQRESSITGTNANFRYWNTKEQNTNPSKVGLQPKKRMYEACGLLYSNGLNNLSVRED